MSFLSSVLKGFARSSGSSSAAARPQPARATDSAPPSYEAAMAVETPSEASAPAAAPAAAAASADQSQSSAAASSSPSTASTSTPRCLDLVFCVDCTGSMSSYISSAQQSMRDIVQKIVAAESVDIQCAIVAYRDWCDKNSSYLVRVYPFASSMKKIQSNINELAAGGGGDAPEAVTAALAEVNNLSYRKHSVRFCILIADANDHGMGESGDSLPNGDPENRDPLQIARQLKEKNVAIYSVACEPALSNTKYGRDFFFTLARITGGRFLPLTSAALLADLVIGGAKEELSLQALEQSVNAEAEQVKAEALKKKEIISESVVAERVAKNLASKGARSHQVRFDGKYQNQDLSNVSRMEEAESLASVRSKLQAVHWGTLTMADGSSAASAAPPRSSSMTKTLKKKTEAAPARARKGIMAMEAKEEMEDEMEAPVAAASSASFAFSSSMAPAPAPKAQQIYSDYAAVNSEQVSRMLHRQTK